MVFVGFAGERAQRVAEALVAALVRLHGDRAAVLAPEVVLAGSDWRAELLWILAKTRVGVFVLTPEGERQPWVHFEAGVLRGKDPPIPVIPVLHGYEAGAAPPDTLADRHARTTRVSDLEPLLRDVATHLGAGSSDGATGEVINVLVDAIGKVHKEGIDPELGRAPREVQLEILRLVRGLAGVTGPAPPRELPGERLGPSVFDDLTSGDEP